MVRWWLDTELAHPLPQVGGTTGLRWADPAEYGRILLGNRIVGNHRTIEYSVALNRWLAAADDDDLLLSSGNTGGCGNADDSPRAADARDSLLQHFVMFECSSE